MPPRASLSSLSTPSAGLRAGVPPAAKMSQPWWKWKVPDHRGISQSSLNVASPAAGKRPKPTMAACCSGMPASSSGCRAASRTAVELGGVRFTLLITSAAPGGNVWGVVGSWPSPSPPMVVEVVDDVDVVVVPDAAGVVVVVVVPVVTGDPMVDVVVELSTVVDDVEPGGLVVVESTGRTSPRAAPPPPVSAAATTTATSATGARVRHL